MAEPSSRSGWFDRARDHPTPEAAFDARARAFLLKNGRFYDRLVARVERLDAMGDDERTLRWIALAAEVAWTAHPGRLSDGRLEAIAIRIGQRLEVPPPAGERAVGQQAARRVLHVATTVYGTGGHTRLLENWVKTDEGSVHSVMLLDQGDEPVRAALIERIRASGGDVVIVQAGTTLLERARVLRRVARSGYDVVVLHHHPNDVTPLVAFATAGGPPIAVMNHADHVFWLGVSVADLVVEYRDFGAELSRERRETRLSLTFPLPLDIEGSTPTREEARDRLGIPESEIMLLTMGAPAKYMPTRRHRFFKAAAKVLEQRGNARLYVIGVGEQNVDVLDITIHDHIKLLGIVGETSDYEAAADLYLEGFPFGSYTALLQTAARGVCPVVMHSPTAHNDSTREVALRGLLASADDENSYVAETVALIDDPEKRRTLGREVAKRVRVEHGAQSSRLHLRRIYEYLTGLTHHVEVPRTCELREERHDLDLAGFQSSRMAIPVAEWISTTSLLKLTLGEFFLYFAMSVKAGDTRWSRRSAKSWLSIIKRRWVNITVQPT